MSGAGETVAESAAAVVDRFDAAWNDHDLAAAMALTSDDCVFESTSPPDGGRFVGRAAVSAAWKPVFGDVTSHFTVEDLFTAGSRVVQRWRPDWPAAACEASM